MPFLRSPSISLGGGAPLAAADSVVAPTPDDFPPFDADASFDCFALETSFLWTTPPSLDPATEAAEGGAAADVTSEGGSAAAGAAPDSEGAAIRTRLFGRRLREEDGARLLASSAAAAAFSVATRFLPLVLMAMSVMVAATN